MTERVAEHATRATEWVRHNRVDLALHTLRTALPGSAATHHPLLLLHGLGEAAPDARPDWAEAWPGAVLALDFTGHGASTVPVGGGYTAELLLADADIALASVGAATVVGRGLGAYIALLLAGTRPTRVLGAVLCDGPGLSGGASVPTTQSVVRLQPGAGAPDPYALFELARDPRPPDYATAFARFAIQGSTLDQPIAVTARFRPAWLAAVADEPGVATVDSVAGAVAAYAAG
jgi:pimeloyl-ACP methyl ester carboxylesterase